MWSPPDVGFKFQSSLTTGQSSRYWWQLWVYQHLKGSVLTTLTKSWESAADRQYWARGTKGLTQYTPLSYAKIKNVFQKIGVSCADVLENRQRDDQVNKTRPTQQVKCSPPITVVLYTDCQDSMWAHRKLILGLSCSTILRQWHVLQLTFMPLTLSCSLLVILLYMGPTDLQSFKNATFVASQENPVSVTEIILIKYFPDTGSFYLLPRL